MSALTALGPLDGRYADKVSELAPFFSEHGLIGYRVRVELAWLKALCAHPGIPEARALSTDEMEFLEKLDSGFSTMDSERVKAIESTTNHDVKAVEYFLREKFLDTSLSDLCEFLHFACTSEDINNLSHAMMLRDGLACIATTQQELLGKLTDMALALKSVAMLARTHGQPASPTTLGKELAVFAVRLSRQSECLQSCRMLGKLNGAVGCYNAHLSAYPEVDWPELACGVIEDELGLLQNPLTTQIESHDYMAEAFDALARWNRVLLDLNRDLWTYIAMGYFGQKTVKGEVGSSTMPHKVNPIDFENSEGNLGLANAMLGHLSDKLPVSRLQRDLSDSTVLRNMGVALGYSLLAYKSTLKGLGKLEVRQDRIAADLENAWEVLAEPVQTVLRKAGAADPYDTLKALTRGKAITRASMRAFIESLDLAEGDRQRLLALTPSAYTGLAERLVDEVIIQRDRNLL